MALIKITDATVEPLTLAQAKRHLREDLSDANNDADIQALITQARTDCENRLKSTLIRSTWRLTLDDFPACLIRLERSPVISVTSIKYYDAGGVLRTIAAEAWRTSDHRIQPVDLYWPLCQDRIGAVEIEYVAGYGDAAAAVPAPLVAWIKLAITDLYEQRGRSAERPVLPQAFAEGLLYDYTIWAV